MKTKVEEYVAARSIPHPYKMKVLTGKAHAMSTAELREAVEVIIELHEVRRARLISLDAPKIIIENETRLLTEDPTIKLLQRLIEIKLQAEYNLEKE